MKDTIEKAGEAGAGVDPDDDAPFTGSSNQRTFTINTPRGPMTGVAGYSVRMGGLGGHGGDDAGDGPLDAEYKPARRKPAPESATDTPREPLVDIYEEDTRLLVTAELPGVVLDDVSVTLEGRRLLIETAGKRPFRTERDLPFTVDPHSMKTSLFNGILEITVTRLQEG